MQTSCTREFVAPIVKPLVPRAMISLQRLASSLISLNLSFSSTLLPQRNDTANMHDTVWLNTVAIAAPFTPSPNTKMNIGSSTMFMTAPISTVTMPIVANPWLFMNAFMLSVTSTGIVPSEYIIR